MHDPYLKRSQPGVHNFVRSASSNVDGQSVAAVTNKKVSCVPKLEPSPLQLPCCTLAVAQHSHAMPTEDIQFSEMRTHLKFTVYGRKQARSVVYTHICAMQSC